MREMVGSWQKVLFEEFNKEYFIKLQEVLNSKKAQGEIILPAESDIYRAFELCTWENVHVVIIGQDPYHGHGEANGLAFSVSHGVKVPPSLKNIYKELCADLKIAAPSHGCLDSWASQGILLINATLTVKLDSAGSHQKIGWEQFTDKIVEKLSQKKENLVFMLWGNYAKKKAVDLIDTKKHLVLTAAHPSPLAASRGFFGCKHFSKCNQYLKENNLPEINWKLS